MSQIPVAHPPSGQPPPSLHAAQKQHATALEDEKTARALLKKADFDLRCHRLRLWATRSGISAWAAGLAIGGATALVVALILIFAFNAGIAIVLTGSILTYAAFGGIVAWFLGSVSGETEGNRLQHRTQQTELAQDRRTAARQHLIEQSAAVHQAHENIQSIQRLLASEAFQRQQETNRLLSIEPGRLYPEEFERYIADIFRHIGFNVQKTGQSGDQGVDVLASKGPLRIAIQAKRHQGPVGNTAIQEVYAGMAHHQCHRCVVVTTNEFTTSAIALAHSTGCTLITGNKIPALIRGQVTL